MKTRVTVSALAVVVAALAAHSLGIAGDGVPSLTSTYPVPLVLPAFFGVPRLLIALAYGPCFALWSKRLFQGRPEIPRRSLVLLVISCLLSCIFFVAGWGFGVKYQGTTYVSWCLGFAVAGAVVLVLLLEWNRRAPALGSSTLFHFILFSWPCARGADRALLGGR